MSRFFPDNVPPVVHHAIARVERHLPRPGEILVRVGSRVEPDDVIARSTATAMPEIVNVAGALGVLPGDVYAAMRKEEGNKVAAGEVIARVGLVGRRFCQSPVNGTITRIDRATGYVTITPDPEPVEVRANVRGLVMEIIAAQTIIIETPATSIYGIAGVGPDRFGVLRLLVTDPSEVIDADLIDARSAYAIVIGGAGITAAALRRAVQEQVRGVIVGGIEAHELMQFLGAKASALQQIGRGSWEFPVPAVEGDPGLTLIITEGFGVRPMSRPMFDLLAASDQQEVLIQGATHLRTPLVRPRLVIPLTRARATTELDPPHPVLAVGRTARLLDESHLGQVGTVALLPEEPETLPSGVRGLAAYVDLQDGERVVVARSALEALA